MKVRQRHNKPRQPQNMAEPQQYKKLRQLQNMAAP